MMKDTLSGSTLIISARSPFARRVRLAFLELRLPFREKVVNVFEPPTELLEANPLGRVPVLVLGDGRRLVDSNQILEVVHAAEPGLAPRTDAERILCAEWSGLALGIAEKVVQYFLEGLRPESARDEELLTECAQIFERVLGRFEAEIGSRETIGSTLTQADLDMGTALTYLSLRYSSAWRERFPRSRAYLDRLEERASFQRTIPPPS
jgi:glutathione S-transferase